MAESSDNQALYRLQEDSLRRLQAMGDSQFDQAKLCGGTALSRCWLGHRVSYDIDFFLPEGFNAVQLALAIKNAGLDFETSDLVDDPRKANQLHGYMVLKEGRLKVSFVEDAYFQIFPAVKRPFGDLVASTEEIPGLYHRKLRTVAGGGSEGDAFDGGRQKARDLFDLYVLSVAFMPIKPFMASLPYSFPAAAFENGLANMPWFELMDELKEMTCDPKWMAAKDVAFLQDALFDQIGAKALDDFAHDADLTTARAQGRPGGHGRGGLKR